MKKLLFFLMLLVSLATQATKYYISAMGSDSNSGLTALLPKQTLTAVNALAVNAGDTVAFKKGDGWLGTLTLSRSGSTGNPIVYTTYGSGATPTITGFTTITSGWTNEGGGIYSKVISSESQTNMVTIDGVQYGMGRYPNSTFLTYESASGYVSITDNELTGTPNWTGAEALIYKNGYRYERDLITSHIGGTLNYTIVSGSNMNASAPNKYFIQNDLRTLDTYGEWYHDFSGTGKLYLYFGAVDPTTKMVKVATLNNTCKTNTAITDITIDGLAFNGSIKQGFIAEYNCHRLTVKNSSFSFIGSDGVYIDGQNAIINNSTFNYCNRISLMAKGANATITNNAISNNASILGQSFGWSGTSAVVIMGDNGIVTGNIIQNTSTNGIFVEQSVDNGLIKNNYIYNTCLHNWDHGSIYTSQFYTNLIIESNIIDTSNGTGIYLDAVGGNITVKNNSVTGCEHSGIHIHSQSNDTIFGNTVYDCSTGVFIQNTSGNNDSHDVIMHDNIVVAKSADQFTLRYYSDYAGYATSFSTYSFYNNVYARPIDETSPFYFLGANKTLAQWKTFVGTDTDATGSPKSISSESDIEFRYNATASPVQTSFSWSGISMIGVQYSSSPTIQPYSSLVLIKNIPNPTGTKKPWGSGGKMWKTRTGLPIGGE